MIYDEQVDDRTVGDLSRIRNENKKLKEKLTIVCDKYNSLQSYVKKLMQDKESLVTNPKKRKHDEQDSWKTSNEKLSKSGIRIVRVQTDPADTSLVHFFHPS